MNEIVLQGLLIPFLGTVLGAACVFLLRGEMPQLVSKMLTGFAAGVMVAASIWSLLLPALAESEAMGGLSWLPAVVGFWLGMGFLLLLDHVIPHLHMYAQQTEGPHSQLSRSTMLVLAVTLHNIPEGMAVGVVLAGFMLGDADITLGGAIAMSVGIAIQNFPEGAIISMPLRAAGMSRTRAFLGGALSGIVEPIGGALTVLLAEHILPFMPYGLAFAAGAMLYVVVEELIPEIHAGDAHSDWGVLTFGLGFTLMMVLDVALG